MFEVTEQVEAQMAKGEQFMVIRRETYPHGWLRTVSPLDKATAEGVYDMWNVPEYDDVRILPYCDYGAEDMAAFVMGNMRCILFAEADDNDERLDSNYFERDFTDESADKIWHDCAVFLSRVPGVIPSERMDEAGIDYHFTRQGHGVGFRDGRWNNLPGDGAKRLYDAVGHYKEEIYVEVGDDGRLYVTGGI